MKRVEALSHAVSKWTGTTQAFACALFFVLVWAASWPLWPSADVWMLVINTFTTIVTFLMVFLIQRSQARDGKALHAKIDAINRGLEGADDKYRGIEEQAEAEVERLRDEAR